MGRTTEAGTERRATGRTEATGRAGRARRGRARAARATVLLGVVAATVAACDRDGISPDLCLAVVLPAYEITVVADATGAPVTDFTATATAGTAVDTLSVNGNVASGPLDPAAGEYDLRVEAPGFTDWTRDDVDVEIGRCGVETTELTARLEVATQPLAPAATP